MSTSPVAQADTPRTNLVWSWTKRIVKIVFPLVVIAWLLSNIEPSSWQELRTRPKHWGTLSVGFALAFLAVSISFVRWYVLVRALDLRFTLRDAFRLSFVGYLFNFISAGNVGGDLFKAIFIAREQPGRRSEAVATVVVDRVIGLYALLIVASVALLTGNVAQPTPAYKTISWMTHMAVGVGGIVVMLLMVPGFTRGRMSTLLAHFPRVGPIFSRLLMSVRVYRGKRRTMVTVLVMSMMVQVLLATAICTMSRAIIADAPSLPEHMIIVPLSMVAGALPLTPSGLGSFEFAMAELYLRVPAGTGNASGVLVALIYRLVTIGIAAVGVVYYWTSRAEVTAVMDQHETDSRAEGSLVPAEQN